MLGTESSLCLFNFTSEFLKSTGIFAEILAFLFLVELDKVIHDIHIEILSTKMSISICSNYFEHTIVNSQEGDIKGTTSKIKDKYVFLSLFFVKTISDSSSCRLIDNPHHIKSRDFSSIFCCLTLSI